MVEVMIIHRGQLALFEESINVSLWRELWEDCIWGSEIQFIGNFGHIVLAFQGWEKLICLGCLHSIDYCQKYLNESMGEMGCQLWTNAD
jgi:hypothetical protein